MVAVYCGQHAKNEMVDISSKRCAQEGCSKIRSFGVEDSKGTVFCRQHVEDGMVNIRRKRGAQEGCS